jgi:hypothetical protein
VIKIETLIGVELVVASLFFGAEIKTNWRFQISVLSNLMRCESCFQRAEADLGVKVFEQFSVRRGKRLNAFQEGLSGNERI